MVDTVFYMSFCDPDLPEGTQFLGGLIVAAETLDTALTVSWLTGCNPGGEVEIAGPLPVEAFRPEYIGRLLNRAEIEAAARKPH